ncbi:hypothetical protein CH296_18175 [Rhodococcus sp. 14-2496-1d]|nr:hypothetical protein CH296_18175 [Rhodococcus sp. 14-2496-1d]
MLVQIPSSTKCVPRPGGVIHLDRARPSALAAVGRFGPVLGDLETICGAYVSATRRAESFEFLVRLPQRVRIQPLRLDIAPIAADRTCRFEKFHRFPQVTLIN